MFRVVPKRFFAHIAGLPTSEKKAALQMLFKAGVKIPTIPTNQVQLAYKVFKKLKRGVEIALRSGSIEI